VPLYGGWQEGHGCVANLKPMPFDFAQDKPFDAYLRRIRAKLATGEAREGAHRAALETLLESLAPGVTAVNEPKHVACGGPDFVVKRKGLTIGWVETKDIGANLDEEQKSKQLKGYLAAERNLILTEYLEFRWYTDGGLRQSATLATQAPDGKIKSTREGIEAVQALLRQFLTHAPEPIGTAKPLAQRMAGKAQLIRDLIQRTFEQEEESGQLHGQLQAFREVLLPDLKPDQFADMYAQTIAYGLFAACCNADRPQDFNREHAAYDLPRTNPFLRKLFAEIAGVNLDHRIAWAVDQLAELLRHSDMAAILEDFGKRTGRQDPVVHFYETFLAAYDPKLRKVRGVYYTPEPVVSYIVRSVDWLLRDKNRFNRPEGLADPGVLILDPACGTGTFLYSVIELIYERFLQRNDQGLWPSYVREKLLPRLFGFEIMMAPYAIAHMKLGIQLRHLHYHFAADERLHIYLTNTLEEAAKKSERLFAQFIADEANAAAEIKRDKPIMVVIGNPPYSVSSYNRGEWIQRLIADYKQGLKERKLNLDDDFVKFLRFAQWRIDRTGHGLLGFITNHTYLDAITHRRLRQCLMESFDEIYVMDLHGSSRKGEVPPDGGKDENVFDIQQGVAIGLFAKLPEGAPETHVHHAELWGRRQQKAEYLAENDVSLTGWRRLSPEEPWFFFVPKDLSLKREHKALLSLAEVLPLRGSGLNTDRDKLCIDCDPKALKQRMVRLFCGALDDAFRHEYGIYPTSSYDVEARARGTAFDPRALRRCLYRPFDVRHIYYSPGFTSRPVYEVMQHLLRPNVGIVCARQTKEEFAVLATDHICTHKIVTVYDRSFVFPLYRYETPGRDPGLLFRPVNLASSLSMELCKRLRVAFRPAPMEGDVEGGLIRAWREPLGGGDLTPEDIFSYIYAILYSPTYRERYAEFLKIDFPRIPLTSDRELFRELAKRGAELVGLHIMADWAFEGKSGYPGFNVQGSDEVAKGCPRYTEAKGAARRSLGEGGRVWINKEQYFEGIEPEVWEFHIGGYQVLEKWLKDRRGRRLYNDDLEHYKKVVVALRETIRLMREIDECIPEWPVT